MLTTNRRPAALPAPTQNHCGARGTVAEPKEAPDVGARAARAATYTRRARSVGAEPATRGGGCGRTCRCLLGPGACAWRREFCCALGVWDRVIEEHGAKRARVGGGAGVGNAAGETPDWTACRTGWPSSSDGRRDPENVVREVTPCRRTAQACSGSIARSVRFQKIHDQRDPVTDDVGETEGAGKTAVVAWRCLKHSVHVRQATQHGKVHGTSEERSGDSEMGAGGGGATFLGTASGFQARSEGVSGDVR
ncbi:hypothetical protein C2E23DRAFT_861037 [Lenzites betulinus]|nr:hypothetical protein C2E23DRAFT_861037 [Lenzites betulinus]